MNSPLSGGDIFGGAFAGGAQRIDVKKIVAQSAVETHFQPLVSIKSQAIVGLEALARGIHDFDGRLILPSTLFRLATAEAATAELDALCRHRALENFADLRRQYPDLLLFLNFYTPAFGAPPFGGERIVAQLPEDLAKHNLPSGSVALEIDETKFESAAALQELANAAKESGFLLAMIGLGAAQSNLERVSLCQPDLLKIDQSLVAGLEEQEHRQETFRALVQLARRNGALAVAQGIESQEQAIVALELGADLLQGFYFARPQNLSALDFDAMSERIQIVADRYKAHMLAKINARKGRHRSYNVILNSILAELSRVQVEKFDACLSELIALYPSIECAYVLDEAGRQVSETICNRQYHRPLSKSSIFHPPPRGADHSLQEYFYLLLDVELNKFTTQPYVSLSTGNLCSTISTLFRDAHNNRMFVLCIDVTAKAN